MNEPLLHAAVVLAARCAEAREPLTPSEARRVAWEIAAAHGLDDADRDELLATADSFSTPMPELWELEGAGQGAGADLSASRIRPGEAAAVLGNVGTLQVSQPRAPSMMPEGTPPFGLPVVAPRPGESLYAGLWPFPENDDGKRFGRNREIAAMVTRLRDQPLMAVVGGAGVDQSSFVRAGLVPALVRSGETWETVVVHPGRRPLEVLAGTIVPTVTTSANLADKIDEQQELVDTLRREPGRLGHVLRERARRDNHRILMFIDQLEELYTQGADPEDRAVFTACLSAIADDATSPLRVVLSIHSDLLGRLAEDPWFNTELTQRLFFLAPPEGLHDTIACGPLSQGSPTSQHGTDEDWDDAALVDQLHVTARQWQQSGYDAGVLWRGDSVIEARKLRQRYDGLLFAVERSFLDAVISFEASQARRRRATVLGGFVGLGATAIAAVVALVIIQKSFSEAKDSFVIAEDQRQVAEDNLRGMQDKENQAAEENAIAVARPVVDEQLGEAVEDLVRANQDLKIALDNAVDSARAARRAQLRAKAEQLRAKAAENVAVAQEDVAERERAHAEALYQQQTIRLERLVKSRRTAAMGMLKKPASP